MQFKTRVLVSLALGCVGALAFVSVALGTHSRPGSATPLRVPLVPAYAQCLLPDTAHAAPLALPACSTGTLVSDMLTPGTTGDGSGFTKLSVICSVPGLPPCDPSDGVNEADVRWDFMQSDVRCRKVDSDAGCPTATSDYTGRLITRWAMRITDHANDGAVCAYPNGLGNPPCVTGTVQDFPFSVPTPGGACVPVGTSTGDTGSTCSYVTTINTVVPTFAGAVKEFQREIISLSALQVLDAGEDNSVGPGCPPICGTGDESRASDQGIFLP
jgi:hypothetical protein